MLKDNNILVTLLSVFTCGAYIPVFPELVYALKCHWVPVVVCGAMNTFFFLHTNNKKNSTVQTTKTPVKKTKRRGATTAAILQSQACRQQTEWVGAFFD